MAQRLPGGLLVIPVASTGRAKQSAEAKIGYWSSERKFTRSSICCSERVALKFWGMMPGEQGPDGQSLAMTASGSRMAWRISCALSSPPTCDRLGPTWPRAAATESRVWHALHPATRVNTCSPGEPPVSAVGSGGRVGVGTEPSEPPGPAHGALTNWPPSAPAHSDGVGVAEVPQAASNTAIPATKSARRVGLLEDTSSFRRD